ncbi:CopD family protein [Gammaproteobacteria bacterium]|jgi:putative membrane protein|nr:CopD family protein [Gammaproteobacteria bacterium]MDA8781291.1 CopD family protein [Gammaproteobacteria bacterium]MDA8781304.1 CopD family protein [Gammaproteobacteria bacterium]MDA9140350.1 CopD family protein [Gammaproteobacteria bacterium]MDB0010258.1 CopD family protein [Gammaproteobacteria bacterium]
MSLYLVFKVLHILFMVSWFAGIFYLPRLFVYHVESENQDTKDQLTTMQTNLIRFITPLGLLALLFGLMMGFLGSDWVGFFSQNWIIAKLFIVLLLILYQIFCWKILKDLSSHAHQWTGFKLRVFNELPVLLLLAGIVAAVFKF